MGTFLRAFTSGHVRQLDAVAARLLAELAARTPLITAAPDQLCFVDVDDTVRATYGYSKQRADYAYSNVTGPNAIIATVSTPDTPPVFAASSLRRGSVKPANGGPAETFERVRSLRTRREV